MNQVTAQEVAITAATEAVKTFYKEQNRLSRQKIFHNTKYLMENYKRIKDNVEEGIADASDMEEGPDIEYGYLDELFIDSIRKGKFRSAIMLSHIDKCLQLLKAEEERKNTPEKYYAFSYLYLDGISYESIAEVYGYNERTARRWINELTDILGVYLFGVDALRL